MRRGLAAALGLVLAWGAQAQAWTQHVVEPRRDSGGQPVTMALAVHTPAVAVRHVVVVPRSAERPGLKPGAARPEAGGPWMTALPALAGAGVALVYLDLPSDAAARPLAQRVPSQVRRDLQAGVDFARERHPAAAVHLGAFATSGIVLDAAAGLRGLRSVALVSMNFLDARGTTFDRIEAPVLVLHAPTAQCDAAPFLEAEDVAQRHGYSFVRAGYARRDAVVGCGANTHHALRGLEADFTRLLLLWFDGEPISPDIGFPGAAVAWREQLLSYDAPGLLGTSRRLEMTLCLPDVAGPVPLVVFNHGDVDADHPSLRRQRRIREMTVAREFLALGIAVAMPARRGVAGSEGSYPRSFLANDADSTYKARVHAEDIVPALEALRSQPGIDPRRLLLAGQSAGGYSAMHVAGLRPPGVVGVVNFSGGRTTVAAGAVASGINPMMVEGFAEFGRSVRVPVLLIFAAGDSRYAVPTIRASHRAFVAAGGKARLLLAGPIGIDGHHVHSRPEVWRAALEGFLAELGLVR